MDRSVSGMGEVRLLQAQLKEKLQMGGLDTNMQSDIQTLLSVLQSPLFEKIVTIEHSLNLLRNQVQKHPSILPSDFDISSDSGQLIISATAADSSPDRLAPDPFPTGADHSIPAEDWPPPLKNSITESEDPAYVNTKCKPAIAPKPRSALPDQMVIPSEWVQVESVVLKNDSNGLGFGIVGGKSTGVIVKTLREGGIADRDRRMRVGDHILAIGDVNLRGMSSEQVAHVLKSQKGATVRFILARSIDPQSVTTDDTPGCAIIPNRLLPDMVEVRRRLAVAAAIQQPQPLPVPPPGFEDDVSSPPLIIDTGMTFAPGKDMDSLPNAMNVDLQPAFGEEVNENLSIILPPPAQFPSDEESGPQKETFEVTLVRDWQGLGITIAGYMYVCDKQEINGIFVKSVAPGSAADLSRRIAINDQIIEVDGTSLSGLTNHEAVEVLRHSGSCVRLRLARYLRGPEFDLLQRLVATADDEFADVKHQYPPAHSSERRSSGPHSVPGATLIQVQDNTALSPADYDSDLKATPVPPPIPLPVVPSTTTVTIGGPNDTFDVIQRRNLQEKWLQRLGPGYTVIVAHIEKFRESGGLGISLEGQVDIEDGKEMRFHHYIRAILAEGPVGVEGSLRSGDEILEVNDCELVSLNHQNVVTLLKELPKTVRMVCGRTSNVTPKLCANNNVINNNNVSTQNRNNVSCSDLLWDQGKNKTSPAQKGREHSVSDRLVKAKSDGSLAVGINSGSSGPVLTLTDDASRIRSRSLEPLTGLAMWSADPLLIELPKGERGLGFSILDYQDPLNPSETVIVVRSLVPGGVAQLDGRLIPGDRLISVNGINLENASLDHAVQALKGAARGVVKIEVCKPLPLPDYNDVSSSLRIHSDCFSSNKS